MTNEDHPIPAVSVLLESDGDTTAMVAVEELARHWIHSREEEDEGSDVQIYRPEDYKEFPPSRFRMQYIFYENGDCKWYYLAPNDAHTFRSGAWRLDSEAGDVIHIEQSDETVFYRIIELTEEVLRMVRVTKDED